MSADLRCSLQQRAEGADPIGTAGSYAGFALVPTPLPWPPDAAEAAPDTARALAGTGVRLQLVAGQGQGVRYRRPPGPFTAYEQEAEEVGGVASHVLVCTHGRRDRCCGSFGTELWQALIDGGLPDGVEAVRTSHTGGHRFAPTVVVLPEGTVWGWVDPTLVRRVLERSGPIEQVLPHYRGCTGLAAPALQALERAALAEVGWPLFGTWRDGSDLGAGRWRLDTGLGSWSATVEAGRRWPVPDCGAPTTSGKADVEMVLRDLDRVA